MACSLRNLAQNAHEIQRTTLISQIQIQHYAQNTLNALKVLKVNSPINILKWFLGGPAGLQG